jgi:hypothetical protein
MASNTRGKKKKQRPAPSPEDLAPFRARSRAKAAPKRQAPSPEDLAPSRTRSRPAKSERPAPSPEDLAPSRSRLRSGDPKPKRKLTPKERRKFQRAQQAALLNPARASAPGVTKGERLAGFMGFDPGGGYRLLGNALQELEDIVAGTPALLAATTGAAGRDIADLAPIPGRKQPLHPGKHLYETLVEPLGPYFKQRYADPIQEKGPAGLQDIAGELHKRPVSGLTDVYMGGSILSKGVSAPRVYRKAREEGLSPKASLRAARVAPRPKDLLVHEGKPYRKGRNVRVGDAVIVHPPGSANALTSYFQDLFDNFSNLHPEAPLVGANRRGAKVKAQEFRLEQDRIKARAYPKVRAIQRISFSPIKNQRLRTRLYWESQLPEQFRNDIGLRAIRDDLERSLGQPAKSRRKQDPAKQRYRRKRLKQKIAALDDVLNTPRTKNYEAALGAMRELSQERKQILVEAGLLDPETAAQREALLAQRLFDVDEPGIYVRHKPSSKYKVREMVAGRLGGSPATKRDLSVSKKNELRLYQEGRNLADPDLVIESWHRAQVFKFHNDVKQFLHDAGNDIGPDGPNPGWFIVNRQGKATPHWWKDMEEGDPEALYKASQEYVESYLRPETDWQKIPGVRQVDPKIVERFFNTLVGPGGTRALKAHRLGQGIDVFNGLVKLSLLYANPGYIPSNLLGNMAFLGLHQGAFAPTNLLRAAKTITSDRELYQLIAAEVLGSGPTKAIASGELAGGGRLSTRLLHGEQVIAHKVSTVADAWPRMAAWYYEALRAGKRSRKDQIELLTSNDPILIQARNQIAHQANEAMVNFSRLGPMERSVLRRIFFVWPWIRGSLAWAGRFPKEYPARASGTMALAPEYADEVKEKLGEMPDYLRQVVVNSVGGDVANISNLASTSPVGTVLTAVDIIRGDKPFWDLVHPAIEFAVNVARQESPTGWKVGQGEAVVEGLKDLSPHYKLGEELAGDTSPLYVENDPFSVLKRRTFRFAPQDIRISEANRLARQGRAKTAEQKQKEWEGGVKKTYGQVPAVLARARRNQLLVSEAREQLKEELDLTKLDDRQELSILFGVLDTVDPEFGQYRADHERLVAEASPVKVDQLIPRVKKALGYGYLSKYGQQKSRKELVKAQAAWEGK